MPWPTFTVIGAAKAGTTTLYHSLRQHPDVHMSPIKEPRYFSAIGPKGDGESPYDFSWKSQWIRDYDEYMALFDAPNGQRALGEASPFYLACKYAFVNMKRLVPDIRLAAVLRDPCTRAFSHHLHFIRIGIEKEHNFEKVIRGELANIDEEVIDEHTYLRRGFYFKQLTRVYESFPKEQVLVFLQEDLYKDYSGTMASVFRHVGVVDSFEPAPEARNTGYAVRSVWLEQGLKKGNSLKRAVQVCLPRKLRHRLFARVTQMNSHKATLSPELRALMLPAFREDTLRLQDMIGRDLSKWLQ